MRKFQFVLALVALFSVAASAQQKNLPADDLDPNFKAPAQPTDFEKRVVMMPMRDGVKLYTVIVIPKGAKDAPILLDRTPYTSLLRVALVSRAQQINTLSCCFSAWSLAAR